LLDVLVEPYYEWVVEASIPIPEVQGMTVVDNLAPFIERKLFTVNTGHCVIAYLGYLAGKETIAEALDDQAIVQDVLAALGETANYLQKTYMIDKAEHQHYIESILERFRNPYLKDTVV